MCPTHRRTSGIDYDACFFHDPDQRISFGAGKKNVHHRKIVQYVTFEGAQAGDEAEGHGTHVVCHVTSLVGLTRGAA